jgi:hypothetical protein
MKIWNAWQCSQYFVCLDRADVTKLLFLSKRCTATDQKSFALGHFSTQNNVKGAVPKKSDLPFLKIRIFAAYEKH